MRLGSLGLCALLATMAAAPTQAQTVIDFDTNPGGSPSTYTDSGVTFSTASVGNTIVFLETPNTTPGLLATISGGTISELRADFLAVLTGSVSVDLGDFAGDPDLLFLELFDGASTSLGYTSLLTLASDDSMHTLTLSGSNIAFAVFGSRSPSVNGSSVYADNFTYSVAAVPEPATWAMMLMGFGAMGVSLRRRRRANNLVQAA